MTKAVMNDSTRTETQSSNRLCIIDLTPRNRQSTPVTVPTVNTIQPLLFTFGVGSMLGAAASSQQTSSARICGTSRIGRPLGREAHFTLSENALTHGGIPTRVTCAIFLQTAPNRKYTARIKADAKINQWILQTRASREANIHFEPVSAGAGGEGTGFVIDPKQKTTGKVVGGKVRIGNVWYGPQRQTVDDLSRLVPDLQPGRPSGLEGLAHVDW
ncbi:MAG: hypothetical protein M1813_009612 [Trichoglossum hirsutum]|nr:MAG: hypothetical protein M1813_009612 [Trichoglossum hirsutum]